MNWAESIYIRSTLRTKRLRGSVIPTLQSLGADLQGLDVLDIGCGPGACVLGELEQLGAAQVTAIDLDTAMVARARRLTSSRGDQVVINSGDVTHLQFPDGRFDAVCNFAVLHHVPDWRKAIAEVARVLRPGGLFISQDHDVAHHDPVSRRLFKHPPDRFDNAQFLAEITGQGFETLGVDDHREQLLLVARLATS
jgi:ubiquinone/menaquinone biosynthesis C-methylase UbiE